MRTIVAGFITLSLCSSVAADCSPDWCFDVQVDRLYPNANGMIYIGTTGDETKLNCTAPGGVYLTLNSTDAGRDVIYSTFLSAMVTGKKVGIQVTDGSTDCRIQYVVLDRAG